MQVVHLTGIEAERQAGFAALYRLLTPIIHRIDKLPNSQRDALHAAFGMGPSGPADRFMVGLGTVSLAAESASFSPLLCVIDDAQWVDRESMDRADFLGATALRRTVRAHLRGTRSWRRPEPAG